LAPRSTEFAVVIPVYNHEGTVREVTRKALGLGVPVFVVDDGSTDASFDSIKSLGAAVRLLRHPVNRGKGAALMTGFSEAARVSRWAITLDADGQHDPLDSRSLMGAAPATGQRPIVVGARRGMRGASVPWTSRFGREFSNFWVRAAGGPAISDSQSGFRMYPLPEVLSLPTFSRRFQFEVEILVKAAWRGMPVLEVPISVAYGAPGERISHFRPFVDFMRNSNTFTRLILQRLLIPSSVRKRG
jgi:glycosyltransferase involved in cell wall biosynthesis